MRRRAGARNAKDGSAPHLPAGPPPNHRASMRLAVRLFLACAVLPAWSQTDALPQPPPPYGVVEVAATWTSIYVGTVSLKMPPFVRNPAGDYESTYVARVFPYFFANESGRITIRVSAEALRQLERGEVAEFTGRAVNQQGEERRVEGKATPADATQGKIKVRVFVSPRIELIFNTTYRFPPPATRS